MSQPWPGLELAGEAWELPVERAIWGSAHNVATDYRWLARTPGIDDAFAEKLKKELYVGAEDEAGHALAWRPLAGGGGYLAVRLYGSRARDASNRPAVLEKHLLVVPALVSPAVAAAALLPRVETLDGEAWWEHRLDPRWSKPEFHLPLQREAPIRVGRGDVEAMAAAGVAWWTPERLAQVVVALRDGATAVLHEVEAPTAAALVCLLAATPSRWAERFSALGAVFSKRTRSSSLPWSLVCGEGAGPPPRVSPEALDAARRFLEMGRRRELLQAYRSRADGTIRWSDASFDELPSLGSRPWPNVAALQAALRGVFRELDEEHPEVLLLQEGWRYFATRPPAGFSLNWLLEAAGVKRADGATQRRWWAALIDAGWSFDDTALKWLGAQTRPDVVLLLGAALSHAGRLRQPLANPRIVPHPIEPLSPGDASYVALFRAVDRALSDHADRLDEYRSVVTVMFCREPPVVDLPSRRPALGELHRVLEHRRAQVFLEVSPDEARRLIRASFAALERDRTQGDVGELRRALREMCRLEGTLREVIEVELTGRSRVPAPDAGPVAHAWSSSERAVEALPSPEPAAEPARPADAPRKRTFGRKGRVEGPPDAVADAPEVGPEPEPPEATSRCRAWPRAAPESRAALEALVASLCELDRSPRREEEAAWRASLAALPVPIRRVLRDVLPIPPRRARRWRYAGPMLPLALAADGHVSWGEGAAVDVGPLRASVPTEERWMSHGGPLPTWSGLRLQVENPTKEAVKLEIRDVRLETRLGEESRTVAFTWLHAYDTTGGGHRVLREHTQGPLVVEVPPGTMRLHLTGPGVPLSDAWQVRQRVDVSLVVGGVEAHVEGVVSVVREHP